MSDIKLFRHGPSGVAELEGESVVVEKTLQTLMEKNLDAFLGVRLLASEYSTGKTHGGRIDTLGIDENNSPVIIEYKRALNENVINQGLFYLDWLLDHQAEFALLAMERLGAFLLALGEVQVKATKTYIAYRRIKNFACVEVYPKSKKLNVYLKIDPSSVTLEPGFMRDVRSIGHYGTGDLEIVIDSEEALERAKPLLIQSYENS